MVASEVGEEGAGEDFAEEGEPDDAGFEDAVIAIRLVRRGGILRRL